MLEKPLRWIPRLSGSRTENNSVDHYRHFSYVSRPIFLILVFVLSSNEFQTHTHFFITQSLGKTPKIQLRLVHQAASLLDHYPANMDYHLSKAVLRIFSDVCPAWRFRNIWQIISERLIHWSFEYFQLDRIFSMSYCQNWNSVLDRGRISNSRTQYTAEKIGRLFALQNFQIC